MVLRKTLYYHLSESGVCIACLCVQKMLASSNKILLCFCLSSLLFGEHLFTCNNGEVCKGEGVLLLSYGCHREIRKQQPSPSSIWVLYRTQAIGLDNQEPLPVKPSCHHPASFPENLSWWFPFYSSLYSLYKLFYCDVFLVCILVLGSCLNLDILFPVIFSLTLQRVSTHQVRHQKPLTIPTENFLCSTSEVSAAD